MVKAKRKEHLLIVRLSAMGDVAMTVPVVSCLRAAYPDLQITVLTRETFRPFFRDVPRIEIFTPDFDERHKGIEGVFRLWRDLSTLGITQLADLHDVLRTILLRRLMRLSGATYTVVDKGRGDKKLLTRKFRKVRKPLKTTVERYREAITRFGYRFELPDVSGRKKTRHVPKSIVERTGAKSGLWVGVAPFAKHPGKIYPTIQTDELIGMLARKYEKVFLFGGGRYERDFTECMEERHGTNVVSVIGRLSLNEEMDLIANLDAIVTMDSATMHIASIVRTPVVSVWGATHPYAGFYGYGQSADNAVQLDLPCRPCSVYGNKPCIFKDYRCMTMISPEMIFRRVVHVTDLKNPVQLPFPSQ